MFNILRVLVLGLMAVATTAGCSVEVPAYNPVLGGFPILKSSIGDVARDTSRTNRESQDTGRARPKAELISLR